MGKKRKELSRITGRLCQNRELLHYIPTLLVAITYTVLMLYLSLTYHKIGGYEVEADFYADFIVQARKILDGDFSPKNFGLKGPVYYILLAVFKVIFGDFFRAGLILNVLASGAFVWVALTILRHLFGMKVSVLAVLYSLSTYAFIHYTYSVGTDMVMSLFAIGTIYFLVARNHTAVTLVLAGLFACLAFLTRYNAFYLYIAGLLCIALIDYKKGYLKEMAKNSGIFLGSSILFGLPWYIPNTIVHGNPIYNDNIVVLKLTYYKPIMLSHPEVLEPIKSLKDLILLNPSHFIKITISNISVYLISDFHELMDLRFSLFIIAGFLFLVALLLTKRITFSRTQWAFFTFPILHFAILVLAPYNIRFNYFRLPFYAALLFIPSIYLLDRIIQKRSIHKLSLVILLALVMAKFYPAYQKIIEHHRKYPDPTFLLDFSREIKQLDLDEGYGIISTKPHLAYHSGLRTIMFPNNLETLEELYEYAQKHRAKILLITANEYINRPNFRFFSKMKQYPGFTPIYYNKYGILYLIDTP